MARISTYSLDTTINDHDRLIGTDGGRIGPGGQIIAGTGGATKNFTIEGLREYINSTINRSIYLTQVNDTPGALVPIEPYTVIVTLTGTMIDLPQGERAAGQDPDEYVPPVDGTWVRISQQNSDANNVLLNVPRFMNTDLPDGQLTIDDRTASFELIYVGKDAAGFPEDADEYTGPSVGWVVIGAN